MLPVEPELVASEDGEAYNKLRRPDDFVTALTAESPPALPPTLPPAVSSTKRKRENADSSEVGKKDKDSSKRFKKEQSGTTAGSFTGNRRRVPGQVKENGMQTMFPGLDENDSVDESTSDALAYLRSVR